MMVSLGQADGKMECALADLNPLFTCPLCKGYLRQPHTVKCCRKSYCRDCLVRVLNQRGSQCANCNEYMGAKLSDKARPDLQLESIMNKLLPQVFAEEEAREEAFKRAREAGYPAFPPEPSSLSAHEPSQVPFSMTSSSYTSTDNRSNNSNKRNTSRASSDRRTVLHEDMFVYCIPEANNTEASLPALQLPYLKIQRRTQVRHLKRLIVASHGFPRAKVDSPEQLDILCKGQVLTGQHSLHFIEQTIWRPKRVERYDPLTLSYRLREVSGTPT